MESGIAKAVRLARGQSALGRLIKRTPQCVQRWETAGKPSLDGCARILAAFPGQITREELLPDVYGRNADGA